MIIDLLDLFILDMSQCGRPDCHRAANSSCSSCGREQYCSSDCQKLDWKKHKSMCPILKKLSNNLQPYGEVAELILDVLFVKKVNEVRILEHLLLYAEYQFGNAVSGIDYRERKDGQRIVNWEVDIILYRIVNIIASILRKNESQLSNKIKNDKMLPYFVKSISLLGPWLVYFDSNISSQTDLVKNRMEMLLQELHAMENEMAVITMHRNQFDASEQHCQRSVSYSRRIGVEGEKKTTAISCALRTFVNLRQRQGDLSGAVSFAEEAYNLVVEAYDPVHPQVQDAASTLIYGLILQGDLENAVLSTRPRCKLDERSWFSYSIRCV
jgi:hypothetical protein